MVKIGDWYYPNNVAVQHNPNESKSLEDWQLKQINPHHHMWEDITNVVGKTDTYATSHFDYVRRNKVPYYNYPWTVTAHDFGIADKDIPDDAHLKEIRFRVRVKQSKGGDVEYPRGLLCVYGHNTSNLDNTTWKETGWHNNLYLVNPEEEVSSSKFQYYDYVLTEENIKKAKITPKDLKKSIMGIDLIFDQLTMTPATVYLQRVALKVDWENPSYKVSVDDATNSEYTPKQIKTGVESSIKFIVEQTKSNANVGNRTFDITLPFGMEAISVSSNSGVAEVVDKNHCTWSNVSFNGKVKRTVTVNFIDYTDNLQAINLSCRNPQTTVPVTPIPNKDYWIDTKGGLIDYGTVNLALTTPNPHKLQNTCFNVNSRVISDDNTITFNITTDIDYEDIIFDINEAVTPNGVKLNPATDLDTIVFDVPNDLVGEEFNIGFSICLIPLDTGSKTFKVDVNQFESNLVKLDVKNPYVYHFTSDPNTTDTDYDTLLDKEDIIVYGHRIATVTDTGAYVLPCKFKDTDSVMIIDKPRINMYKWEELDYIGCVPLEHLHFDPKSTYKDKLLDSHYKNARYMGKELASDEDITLNVRLHPPQVTTIQGLIDMDKPIPINANHKCFEGDALNHRGWAEIYAITSEKTNPSWYKCDIDVKYLTHNLNTRFKIKKGDKSFKDYPFPSLLTEINESGDAINGTESSDYFNVDTDGTYEYIEPDSEWIDYVDDNDAKITWIGEETEYTIDDLVYTGNNIIIYLESLGYTVKTPEMNEYLQVLLDYDVIETQRNMFTLDEGQHIIITSKQPVANVSEVAFDWSSSKVSEDKENNISRIVRLIDYSTNDVVFEYEYTDFDFEDDALSCQVIGRRLDQGDYTIDVNEEIYLRTDLGNENVEEDDEVDYFGSLTHYRLNNNNLTIIEEGFSGREYDARTIQLEGESYLWQCEWVNKNIEASTGDITAYFDIVVSDTLLNTKYSDKYGSMYVSPFPVSDKKILFTRNAEEGIIYYLEDDKKEFSYLIEPYYQYHNGVDLRNSAGASIFSLNYGWRTVYLENGLVSLGINRLNGEMYLRRYDPSSKSYITLFNFKLTHYDDVNINSISDDVIELQASNTLISMYRGHPYVVLKHTNENIEISSNFDRVWCQKLDDLSSSNYPAMFDLCNHSNLLDECVLNNKCLSVELCESDVTNTSITVDADDTVNVNVETALGVDGLNNGEIYYLIDGKLHGSADASTTLPVTFTEANNHEIVAVYVGNSTTKYSVSPVHMINVIDPTPTTPATECPQGSKWKLKITECPDKFVYMDGKRIEFQLLCGNTPIKNKTIERIAFQNIWSQDTNSQGKSSFLNNQSSTQAGEYSIGARVFNNGVQVTQVYKKVKVEKGSVIITMNDEAHTKGGTASFHFKDGFGNPLKNVPVSLYVNGHKTSKKTNGYGNASVKVNTTGWVTYKIVFSGNKFYKSAQKSFKEKVANG